jgi:hypothetical protein
MPLAGSKIKSWDRQKKDAERRDKKSVRTGKDTQAGQAA